MGIQDAVTEPPITRALSGSQLLDLRERPLQIRLPGCSVAVECGVKDVTEAALVAADSLERDEIVFQKMESRKKYPLRNRNKVKGK